MLCLMMTLTDINELFLKRYHVMLYYLVLAMYPRMLVTVRYLFCDAAPLTSLAAQ